MITDLTDELKTTITESGMSEKADDLKEKVTVAADSLKDKTAESAV